MEENKVTVETGAEENQEVKTYTQEEVDKLLQQETDRRVTSALKKQQQKFENERAEAEKLRDMDEAQKKEYEFQKRVAELEADYIVAEDAETMMTNINDFEKAWKAALADAVNARLAAPAPKGSSVSQTGMTKEQFAKLTVSQQAELYKTNPELYKQMTAR